MKLFTKVPMIAIASMMAFSVSNAQSVPTYTAGGPKSKEPVIVSPLNCDALNKGSLVCVVNKTHSAIREIMCDGLFGKKPIAVPGGRIPPGGIGVVDFNNGNCNTAIYIKTGDGQEHKIGGQNIKSLTTLNIETEEGW